MKGALFRFTILLLILVISPLVVGLVRFYGCVQRTTNESVLSDAKAAYLGRVRANANDLEFIKCSQPTPVKDNVYGIPAGAEWSTICAYIRDSIVYASEAFQINRCTVTRHWEHVDEGFPKPLQNSGYENLL